MERRSKTPRRKVDNFLIQLSQFLDVLIAYVDKEVNETMLEQAIQEVKQTIELSDNVFGRRKEDLELQLQIMAKFHILIKKMGKKNTLWNRQFFK